MCDAEDPCSVNATYGPESSFKTSPRGATRLLRFGNFVSKSEMLRWHKSKSVANMTCFAFLLCLLDDLLSTFDFWILSCRKIRHFVPLFVNSGFRIRDSHCLRHGNRFAHKIAMTHKMLLLFSNVIFMISVLSLLNAPRCRILGFLGGRRKFSSSRGSCPWDPSQFARKCRIHL